MDDKIEKAIAMGERNLEIAKLAHNFCKNLTVEKSRMGGTGIVEQMTGLPIGLMECRCRYARAHGLAGGNSETIALDFYDRNCVDCDKREAVGMPSLLNIVDERNKKEAESKKKQEIFEHLQAKKLEQRKKKRAKIKTADQSRNSILDLIDKIDSGSRYDAEKLIETAKIASDKFDVDIQRALFELIDTDGFLNVECAIEVLTIVANKGQSINTDKLVSIASPKDLPVDLHRLVILSLKALDKGSGHNEAATVVDFWFEKKYGKHLTDKAIFTLIRIAYPARDSLSFSVTTYRPGPLQKIYEIFPEKVLSVIQKLLKVDEKWTRVSAAGAASYIIEKDGQFGIKIGPALLDSLSLPDDRYEGGSARGMAMHTLGKALINRPDEIDKMIQEKIEKAEAELKGEIFSAYDMVFREDRRTGEDKVPKNVKSLAIKRVLETLIAKPHDKRLEEATDILRGLKYGNITCLVGQEDLLLGAAVQITTELDNPYSPLTDPRPDPIKALEASSRRIHLQSALDAIQVNIGHVGRLNPVSIGNTVIECIKNLQDKNSRLKSALVSTLGSIGSSAIGLPLVLPTLSAGFVDKSALVRSAAIEAYSELMKNETENLPTTIHELYCASFSDPYVVVHQQAVYVLWNLRPRKEDVPLIISKLILLIMVYRQEQNGTDFLARCIDQLLNLSDRFTPIERPLANFILQTIPLISPYERVKIFQFHRYQLRKIDEYSKQLALLLSEKYVYSLNLDEVVEIIKELSSDEIIKVSDILGEGVKKLITNNIYGSAIEIIELLSWVYCWDKVLELTRFFVNSIEDTVENKSLRLKAQAYKIAAEVEVAVLSKDGSTLEQSCQTWKDNLSKIHKDDEENSSRRDFFRGIRLPR